jgi:hypothetical protein
MTSAQANGKAVLQEKDNPSSRVTFGLNPTQLSFSRSVKFNREPNESRPNDPPAQFKGTQATSLQLALLLDAMGSKTGEGVQAQLDRLVGWTTVPANAGSSASTPRLVFSWGSLRIGADSAFPCFLEDLKVTVEMFARDGTPLRASVTLSLKSDSGDGPAPTNPTSGTESSRRRRVLQRGQSLQSLAYDEYGDAGAWRAVAELNGIDDPTRLRTGAEILLPDRHELVGNRS